MVRPPQPWSDSRLSLSLGAAGPGLCEETMSEETRALGPRCYTVVAGEPDVETQRLRLT